MKKLDNETLTPHTDESHEETGKDLIENLQIALSLARGNSPAIKHGARLDKIAFHIERAIRCLPKPATLILPQHQKQS